MKAEIEARIADLKAQLAQEQMKLDKLVADIPEEFHNITQEVWDKLKSIFG